MLTRKHWIEGKNPFGKAAELFNALDADAAMKLAMVAGDVTLILVDRRVPFAQAEKAINASWPAASSAPSMFQFFGLRSPARSEIPRMICNRTPPK